MDMKPLNTEMFMTLYRFRQVHLSKLTGNMSKGEYYSLEALQQYHTTHPDSKGMYVSSLAKRLRISPPAVSRMLKSLEEKGLVERTVDASNRRNTYIRLTDHGAHMTRQVRSRMQFLVERVYDQFGEEDMRTMIALLNRLVDTAEKEIQAISEGVTE